MIFFQWLDSSSTNENVALAESVALVKNSCILYAKRLHLPSMWPEWLWDSGQQGCATELWPHQAPSVRAYGQHPELEDLYLGEIEKKMRKRESESERGGGLAK